MNKLCVYLILGMIIAATLTAAEEPKGSVRSKRGHGHGHGYGHGPGAGGGARGPIYFCGWVGSKMGYGGGYHG